MSVGLCSSATGLDFSDVQIVHKFAGRVIPDPDFKDTSLFSVEYLRNDMR